MWDVFNSPVIPSFRSAADVNVAPPSTDTESCTTPTRANIGGTQKALIGVATTPGEMVLLKRHNTFPDLKHGPATLTGNPPSNIPTFGVIVSGTAKTTCLILNNVCTTPNIINFNYYSMGNHW